MELGVSYFGNRMLGHFLRDLEEIRGHHCTYVVHTFNENDQMFYRETMREFVQATKEAGLKAWVDPWGVGRVFGGEAFSNFTSTNPDAVQIADDGLPTHCACPNSPKFRDFMARWIEDAVYLGADVLFWDEPHFYLPTWLGGRPGTWACTCKHCRAHWEELHAGKPFPGEMSEELRAARDTWILEFLRFLTDKTAEHGVANAVCLLPLGDDHPHAAENWEEIASLPNVSIIGTDPYWLFTKQSNLTLENYVRPHTEKVMALAKRHRLQAHMWLQGFKIPAGRERELIEAVKIFADSGCRNIATWAFKACDHISWIRSEDSEKVWATIGEAYAQVKDLR